MKATKKIVGAACALVAATALAAGSTFAWFSSNGTVSATGLNVNVSTNNAYLIIAENTTALTTTDAADLKELDLSTIGKTGETYTKLLPSAYKAIESVSGKTVTLKEKTTKEEGATETGAPSITTATTWYTGQGTNFEDGTIELYKVGDDHPTNKYAVGDEVPAPTETDPNAKKTLAEGDDLVGKPKPIEAGDELIGKPKITYLSSTNFSNYVVEANMVISVSEGSVGVENVKLTMASTFTDSTKDCPIQIVILYQTVAPDGTTFGTAGANWSMKEISAKQGLGAGIDLGPVESSIHHIAVKVLVYMDGHNEKVTTANQANLSGVVFDFDFEDADPATVTP